MVARIAPSPITSNVASGDAPPHAASPVSAPARQSGGGSQFADQQIAQNTAANVPPPPSPPGEAFAAAVIAGQLPPRPITPEQLRQRLGSAWQPPASPLRLMDRSA